MKRSFLPLFGALLLLLAAIPVSAQEVTASIQGTVTDQSGAALPGVAVDAVNERGQRLTATTDAAGRYRLPSVPPGTYTVTATLAGMEPSAVRNLVITLGASPKVDLKLRLGVVKEAVTVTAEAPIVDVTQSAKSTSIKAADFERLPKGRDFTSIVTQAAGANAETKAAGISIDGATGLENRFVVDGIDVTDPHLGTTGKRIITDIVEEVQVKSSGYEAEYGGATGGVINVITKSGRNEFNGSVSGYYRDHSWDGSERPSLQENKTGTGPEYVTFAKDKQKIIEPGFAVGGPIMKDRLWFFGAYQPSRTRTNRTVTFSNPGSFPATQTFKQDVKEQNILANVNGNFGTRALFKVAGNISPTEVKNPNLPERDGRSNADPSLYNGKKDTRHNSTFSGYFDLIPSQSLYLSARGGRLTKNFEQSGISSDDWKWFYRGSNAAFPDTPADLVRAPGFRTGPRPLATSYDKFGRNSYSLEASYFANALGSHSLKAGFQGEKVTNSVLYGDLGTQYRFQWNRNDRFLRKRGKYGSVAVMKFQTTGDVSNTNNAIFAQDSWSLMGNRLTLNLGVRAEHERIPQYSDDPTLPKYPIDWGFGKKIAPRLGFAYDVFGDGRTKVYGSYGKFYDIMKLAMARGAFGGDKWLWHAFTLDTTDWQNFKCTGVSNVHGTKPTCTSGTYLGVIDLREPDLGAIDPDLKPMASQEFTLGGQRELGNQMAFGVRYVHKNLLRAIEDLGSLVQTGPQSFSETYMIGNPGFGLAGISSGPIPAFPKATRKYDGLEFEFTKRFGNNWGLHAGYLYSRLFGNYSGLANEDEGQFGAPRIEPNISRWGDFIETLFDASGSGRAPEGRLPTDRPHQLKAQLSYSFPFGSTLGVSQYVGSGTPVSTQMYVNAAEFYPFGRGDLGRTPWLKQTDLYLAHRFPLSRYGFEVALNVLNLFDAKTAVAVYQAASQDSVAESGADFFKGFNARAELAGLPPDVLYRQSSRFQAPREVRLQARFTF
jgi:hypothetical protein